MSSYQVSSVAPYTVYCTDSLCDKVYVFPQIQSYSFKVQFLRWISLKSISTFNIFHTMSLLGCHLPSMPWNVGQMGATSWTESTGHNFILWWAMRLFPLIKMQWTLPNWTLFTDTNLFLQLTQLYKSQWGWTVNGRERIFCLADLVHCCLPRN